MPINSPKKKPRIVKTDLFGLDLVSGIYGGSMILNKYSGVTFASIIFSCCESARLVNPDRISVKLVSSILY